MTKKISTPRLTRRNLLSVTALGTAGTAVAAGIGFATSASSQTVVEDARPGIRQSINALDPNGRTVGAYRRAVAVMKSRPFSDPTSWSYQAAIHGMRSLPPQGLTQEMFDNIGKCIHGHDAVNNRRYFLPWHRLYLHFFERIVRDASGDPSFMLPYWDYSAGGGNRLPLAFRSPANATNALFEARRSRLNPDVNAGGYMAPTVVDDSAPMAQPFYDTFSDTLERAPHGSVHVAVGGFGVGPQSGLMTTVPTSAGDPIFWLHHCNIDRLWSHWTRDTAGPGNPTGDNEWMSRDYTFFDEAGTQQTRYVSETLDSGSLGFEYDDERPVFGGFRPFLVAGTEGGVVEETLATTGGLSLSGERSSVSAAAQGDAEGGSAEFFFTDIEDEDSRPIVLRITGLSFEESPGILYEVYINLPEGEEATPTGPHYAGLLVPFGFENGGGVAEIDVTGVLNRQIAAGTFLGGAVQVDFVPFGLPEEGAAESGIVIPELTMENIEIIRR